MPELNSFVKSNFDRQCALVLECGQRDLRETVAARSGRGLEGQALRDAAKAASECVQAMHSSGFVWTDLKTQNFVVMGDDVGTGDSTSSGLGQYFLRPD